MLLLLYASTHAGKALWKGRTEMQLSIPPLFRRWRGANVFTRHAIVLFALGILLLGSMVGGHLLGAFAQSSCARGDASYNVRFGDTLSAIAARYRMSWQRLASYNHLANANLIYPGQLICVPSKGSNGGGGGSGGSGGSGGTGGSHQYYVNLARQDALNVGFSPDVFVRQINQESGFNPSAVSPAGAIGIAQFLPSTAASLGVNPWNPVQSLQGASRLMANYTQQYGGNVAKALAAYNAGPGTVQRAVSLGGAGWRAFLPAETQNYIRVILG